jgi:hypothetical protein
LAYSPDTLNALSVMSSYRGGGIVVFLCLSHCRTCSTFLHIFSLSKRAALLRLYWHRSFRLYYCQTFLFTSGLKKGFLQFCCNFSTSGRYSLKGHLKCSMAFFTVYGLTLRKCSIEVASKETRTDVNAVRCRYNGENF